MNRDRWQLVAMMRRSGASYRSISIDLDMTTHQVMRACAHYHLTQADGYSASLSDDSADMWPEVPWHVRLTDRGHSQAIFIQGGQG